MDKNFAHIFIQDTYVDSKSRGYDLKNTYKIYPNTKSKKLSFDRKKWEQAPLISTYTKNKSTRSFSDKPIRLEDLSALLELSFGIKETKSQRRYYPSAGKRYPIEVYVAVFNAKDFENGVYHYNVLDNSIELMVKGDFQKEMFRNSCDQDCVNACAFQIYFSSVFFRTTEKYGKRGVRYVFLDAGHMGQNLYLISSLIGLGVVAIGGFDDVSINHILRLDDSKESVIYCFALGYPQ